jgi:DNA polymerase V
MDGESWRRSTRGASKEFSQQDHSTDNITGFGDTAHHYGDKEIDLNKQLIRNKPATHFLRVNGDAMSNAGIVTGDILIVDRSLKATNGKIVVALLNGEMLVRRFEKTFNRIRLIPETEKLSTIEVDTSSCEFSIWGVATYVIHCL